MILHRIESDYCNALYTRVLMDSQNGPRYEWRQDCTITNMDAFGTVIMLILAFFFAMALRHVHKIRD